MRYSRSVSWIFEQKDWPLTLLWLAAASLVPMVGQIVANGYQAAATVELGRGGAPEQVRPFDLNRLADYLIKGLRLFLVGLVASVVLVPVILVGIFGLGIAGAVAGAAAGSGGEPSVLVLLLLAGGVLALALLAMGVASLVAPLWLRAAYLEDLGSAYDLEFCKDFWRRVGWTAMACHLGMALLAIVLVLMGMLACFVGIFPAIAIVFLAQAHLYAQLYRIYLDRGGMPITPPATSP